MGGHVFKDQAGQPGTQRIRQDQVVPTVKWLEQLTGLSLVDNMLGTTGRKETSGDLDLAVDSRAIDKQTLIDQLIKQGITPADIKKTGDSVHLKTPIMGDVGLGYVQTDFMFGDPAWQRFSMQGGAGDKFKGVHRHLLMASIAKSKGMKWSYKHGLLNRDTNDVISTDPEAIAQALFGGHAQDLNSVESIIAKIKNMPDYESMIADFKDALSRDPQGPQLELESAVLPGTGEWFRKWSDKF